MCGPGAVANTIGDVEGLVGSVAPYDLRDGDGCVEVDGEIIMISPLWLAFCCGKVLEYSMETVHTSVCSISEALVQESHTST